MGELFEDRNTMGNAAEQIVFHDLRSRGWNVEHGPRHFWSAGLNRVLNDWEDCHSAPCFLRWAPDWMVWRSDKSVPSRNLYAAEVKHVTRGYHIERTALQTYQEWARQLNVPVIVIFEFNGGLLASSVGKLSVNTKPHFAAPGEDRTPFYEIDVSKLSPMERWFGVKP